MGQDPSRTEKLPGSPPFREVPNFGTIPTFPGFHFKHPLLMGREFFQEIRDYMLLLIISEYTDGITGYHLQEKYNFPRGTLIRTLQDLEDKDYLSSKEEIIEGRTNKFYMITEEGKSFLGELKLKWANLFGIMAELNPPEVMKTMIFEKIDEFQKKPDAIDFFKSIRSWIKGMIQHIEGRIQKFKRSEMDLNLMIEKIEIMDSLNKEKIKGMVIDSLNKIEEDI